MKNYEALIAKLRQQMAEADAKVKQLEAERAQFEEQRQRRAHYLSSRDILELLVNRGNGTGSMASIKRWADDGHLGPVIDERLEFPLLAGKQGKKRNLYLRFQVYRFLHEKGLLSPKFDVLDRVQLILDEKRVWAVITAFDFREAELVDDLFVYQVQVEGTGEVYSDIAENALYTDRGNPQTIPRS
ncbi:hypothetical protein NDK47_12850 [Brevibacillus ruminantium]|uniref:Uncharacterized protein n=1 Tax=Brevibacillus ruminantium TaxID=2950604 RepID=A0ABY4WU37_9BACL|nr:hypothetical protein [Brevibacillus ruminantium]USG68111.1 hypothetical protein NDK47_12850 [Brevibacillus ruminantium]